MPIFIRNTGKKQMQQLLDQETSPQAMTLAEECQCQQEPQQDRPMFKQPGKKNFEVDLMDGCCKP